MQRRTWGGGGSSGRADYRGGAQRCGAGEDLVSGEPQGRSAVHDRRPLRRQAVPRAVRDPEAIQATKDGKPLPPGTVLTLVQYKARVDAQGNSVKDAKGRFVKGDLIAYAVMEKRPGWGAEYPDDLRNGEWEYAAFGPDGKLNEKANYKGCFQCHKPHEKIDFVISNPALAGRSMVASAAPTASPGTPVSIMGFAFGPNKLSVAPGYAVTR